MLKKEVTKERMLKQIQEIINELEKNEEIDLDNINDRIINTAYANKLPFEEVVKDETLKKLEEKIEDLDVLRDFRIEKTNINSLVDDFMPNYRTGYFKNYSENWKVLEELEYNDDDFVENISSEVEDNYSALVENGRGRYLSNYDRKGIKIACYMEVGIRKILEDYLYEAKSNIDELDLDDYEFDENNLRKGDLKALYNAISEKNKYSDNEIKHDILYDKFLELRQNEDKDLDKINSILEKLSETNSLVRLEKNIDVTMEEFKKENLEKRWDIFDSSKKETLEKIWKKVINSDFSGKTFAEKTEIVTDNFNTEIPKFKVFIEEEVGYDSENYNKLSNKLIETIIAQKGEEYLDNMDIYYVESWEDLKDKDIVAITYDGIDDKGKKEEREYLNYYEYLKNSFQKYISNNLDEIKEEVKEMKKIYSKKGINNEILQREDNINFLKKEIKEFEEDKKIFTELGENYKKGIIEEKEFNSEKKQKEREELEEDLEKERYIKKSLGNMRI